MSTDSSLKILESYKDSRINIIKNTKNIDITYNKDIGIYYNFLGLFFDCDDLYFQYKYEDTA